jgi:hypothetical protein
MSRVNRRKHITASEIGDFVYCAKAWHLKRCGETAQSESLEEGLIFHQKHGAQVSQSQRLNRAGKSLAVIALILLVILILYWLGQGDSR